MKEIKLRNSEKDALIDGQDYDFINQFKWYIDKMGYAHASIKLNGIRKNIFMHRLILGLTDPKIEVDHANHIPLDNQRYNLRTCTRKENSRNRRSSTKSFSKYLGVSFINKGVKLRFRGTIEINNKSHHLGYFNTEELAALAYDAAAKIHHGKFANLNFK